MNRVKPHQLIKRIEMNIRRIEQWMSDSNSNSPRLIKVLSSLDAIVSELKDNIEEPE